VAKNIERVLTLVLAGDDHPSDPTTFYFMLLFYAWSRYERSGTLHGLMRVRGFTQDDAHIFCLPSQLQVGIAPFETL
jgi:hypothetical protein